jgi:hypothetical protein
VVCIDVVDGDIDAEFGRGPGIVGLVTLAAEHQDAIAETELGVGDLAVFRGIDSPTPGFLETP